MNTKVLNFQREIDPSGMAYAASLIQKGELVAFPTETVYGLGANAFLEEAVKKIFQVKGRPQDNPLIVHLSDFSAIEEIAKNIPQLAYDILEAFAPGPITIILQKTNLVPDLVSAGLDTVAIRFPSNHLAQELIKQAKVPLVAPSANLSGRPSPTRAWHVYEDLKGKIPCIIDGGPCEFGLESTILDLSGNQGEILRPGFITAKDIKDKLSVDILDYQRPKSIVNKPKAPGQKYKHYSPKAKVIIINQQASQNQVRAIIENLPRIVRQEAEHNREFEKKLKIGFFLSEDLMQVLDSESFWKKLQENLRGYHFEKILLEYSSADGANHAANQLFDVFRKFDRQGTDFVLCTAEEEAGKGLAYMNRLEKAASFKI